jgi:hypothetical protein
LNPHGEHAADLIDADYLQALRHAVPRKGQAWTYSHFPAELLPAPAPGETVINASCDTIPQALAAVAAGRSVRDRMAVHPRRRALCTVPGRAGRKFQLRPMRQRPPAVCPG